MPKWIFQKISGDQQGVSKHAGLVLQSGTPEYQSQLQKVVSAVIENHMDRANHL